MSQPATFPVPTSGPVTPSLMASDINASLTALLSGHKGSSRPSYAVAGTRWVKDVSSTVQEIYEYDGAIDIKVATYNPTTHALTQLTIPAKAVDSTAFADTAFTGLTVVSLAPTDFIVVSDTSDSGKPKTIAATDLIVSGGMKNILINGKMDIAQRGTSFTGVNSAAAQYSVDRWRTAIGNSTAIVTLTQQADAPSNDFQNSLRVAVTTADAAVGASDIVLINQIVEGYSARALIGKTFTLSFWVRSAKTGIHCAFFENSGADRTYVAEYTVNAANTWEYKTITVSGGLITAGTWNWTNGYGLSVGFTLMSGSTYQTTANAWQTGNFAATSNQVNVMDTIGNVFAVTGVQLELGGAASAFDHRPIGHEVLLCKRYYEKNFPLGTAPAQNISASYSTGVQVVGASTAQSSVLNVQFTVEKRALPTITLFNPLAANAQMRDNSNSADWSGTTASTLGTNAMYVNGISPAGSAVGQLASVNWTADAEL